MAQLQNDLSTFLTTTPIFDVTQIQSMDVKSPEFKELIIRLTQHVNNQSLAINAKDTGLYDTQEYVSGQAYFPTPTVGGASSGTTTPTNRAVYRKVINFGALPNGAVKAVAHGITVTTGSAFSITRIYGASTNPTTMNFIPIPYVDITSSAWQLSLYADATNVYITAGGKNWTAWTQTYVVIEYMKT